MCRGYYSIFRSKCPQEGFGITQTSPGIHKPRAPKGGGKDHARLSGIAYDNFDIVDAFLCQGVLGNLCQLGTIFEAGDEAVWPRGVGPEHGRVADVDTDFENYFSKNHPH